MALVMASHEHVLGGPPAFMPPGSYALPTVPVGPPQGSYAAQPRAPVPAGFQQVQQQAQSQRPPQPGPRIRPQQQQLQQQQKALGPRTSRGKKRKHRWHNKSQAGKDSGLQSLAALSAQNRRRAQQHFGNGKTRGGQRRRVARRDHPGFSTVRSPWADAFAYVADTPSEAPRTVPHAPHNDNSFILSQHGRGSTGLLLLQCYLLVIVQIDTATCSSIVNCLSSLNASVTDSHVALLQVGALTRRTWRRPALCHTAMCSGRPRTTAPPQTTRPWTRMQPTLAPSWTSLVRSISHSCYAWPKSLHM